MAGCTFLGILSLRKGVEKSTEDGHTRSDAAQEKKKRKEEKKRNVRIKYDYKRKKNRKEERRQKNLRRKERYRNLKALNYTNFMKLLNNFIIKCNLK